MGRKRTPGLIKRGGTWQIDKWASSERICLSTGTGDLAEAERFLARILETRREAKEYGIRPKRAFKDAAEKFLEENTHKKSLRSDRGRLKLLAPFIDAVPIDKIHIGTLQPWIKKRKSQNAAIGTINHGLKIIRRILNLAATEWRDEHGLTWLHAAPRIKLLPDKNKRKPYPLSWDEQGRLFAELPHYIKQMALFAVNTGCRDQEVCQLRWQWEQKVPALNTLVFIIPGKYTKNGDERLVVLNHVARSVIESCRGTHTTHVFTYDGRPVSRMLNHAWRKARTRAGLDLVRVHDLKHTFGHRLRDADVSFEDRQDLLGHRSGRITSHYSAPNLAKLISAANQVCQPSSNHEGVVVFRRLSVS